MNRIKHFLNRSRPKLKCSPHRYFARAQALIRAAAERLREARRLKPEKLPECARDVFYRDVEDLLREARRYVRKGRRAKKK